MTFVTDKQMRPRVAVNSNERDIATEPDHIFRVRRQHRDTLPNLSLSVSFGSSGLMTTRRDFGRTNTMQIGEWSATPDLNEIYREIRDAGLETNLAELEAFGFTVVPDALSREEVMAMRDLIVRHAEGQLGRKLDIEKESQSTASAGSGSDVSLIPFLLYKDPLFKRGVINQKTLPLITYLLGKQCILSSLTCHLKGPGGHGLLLHSDNGNNIPDPFPPFALVANCNYALTDYTEAGGSLAMVPGSHRQSRQTTKSEMKLDGNDRYQHVIPVEVPAGSAIIWHGNTWHGSFPRTIPGLRINLSTYFCREFIQPQENYRTTVPEGFLDPDKEERLARLLGADLAYGWTDEGPLKYYKRRTAASAGVRSWYS
ncbi:MAG: phytanoyl-CoA dioxygenase family protein [Hyphomonadaceae bacterium]